MTKVVALDRVNLKLYEGQITVLLGSNDAGKSVLAEILAGRVIYI